MGSHGNSLPMRRCIRQCFATVDISSRAIVPRSCRGHNVGMRVIAHPVADGLQGRRKSRQGPGSFPTRNCGEMSCGCRRTLRCILGRGPREIEIPPPQRPNLKQKPTEAETGRVLTGCESQPASRAAAPAENPSYPGSRERCARLKACIHSRHPAAGRAGL